jgi:hypothetical protein
MFSTWTSVNTSVELTCAVASVGLEPGDKTVSFDGTMACDSQIGFPSAMRSVAGILLSTQLDRAHSGRSSLIANADERPPSSAAGVTSAG